MADESKTFKIVGSLIALLAAGSGIVALLTYIIPPKNSDNQTSESANTRQVSSDKPNENSSSRLPANNLSESDNKSSVTEQVKCKVAGTIYDEDKNRSPMPNVKVYLTDNQKDTFLVRTNLSGNFKGDCSQIPQNSFPQRLKIITSSNLTLIDPDYSIPSRGREEDLFLYVSENEIKKNAGKTAILRIFTQRQIPKVVTEMTNEQSNKQVSRNGITLTNQQIKKPDSSRFTMVNKQ